MLPTNILYRTYFIRAAQYGTAFALDVGETQYLVTARHLLPETGTTIELQVLHEKRWLKGEVRVVARGRGELDIAVLQPPTRFTPKTFEIELGFGEISLGQDVYFLGFPYKLWTDYGELSAGLPGPFLKKGALSAVTFDHPKTLHVDAINNEGFSGGPLYFFRNGNPQEPRVAGIVSKYRTEHEPVVDEDGQPTGLRVAYNTGFLVAYDIKHALELINASGA
jgi:Trypsin-like peptidase domain